MPIVTIPKKLAYRDDLVVIPRKEYEKLIAFKRIREFIPSAAQKRALERAERNFRKDKTLSFDELLKDLGSSR